MRLLLDTNAFIWWLLDREELSTPARDAIADGSVDVSVSAVSAFEISTKAALGKLTFEHDISAQINGNGFRELPVTVAHAAVAGSLPLVHRDPFDRLLIGQAVAERMTVATRDAAFLRYGVPVLRA